MSDDHAHSKNDGNMRRVLIALVITGLFMVVEVIGGILSGSLALLADAGHMLTDTMALALAAVRETFEETGLIVGTPGTLRTGTPAL